MHMSAVNLLSACGHAITDLLYSIQVENIVARPPLLNQVIES